MVGCYIWYSEEGTGPSPLSPLLAVPNVTAHPSTASVPNSRVKTHLSVKLVGSGEVDQINQINLLGIKKSNIVAKLIQSRF